MSLRLFAAIALCGPILLLGCSAPVDVKCTPSCAAAYVCQMGSCVPNPNRDAGEAADLLTGKCSPPCTNPAPYCNASNRCVACRADGDCPLGTFCKTSAGGGAACVVGCDDDSRCRSGSSDGGAGPSCCGGACVDTTSDAQNCGTCGTACSAAHSSAACARGACTPGDCALGWGDCNHDPRDGCEAALRVDPANCGACGAQCTFANAVAACASYEQPDAGTGGCYISACNFGFDDCDGDPTNGCETAVLSDANNCGGCATPCKVLPNAKVACANAVCALSSCNMNFADCNGDPKDGCESQVGSDIKNCGSCGHVCAVGLICSAGLCTCAQCNIPNASSTCINNNCVFDKCNPGFADCNKNPMDGCESGLNFDKNNCGACGNTCPMNTPYCINGMCSATGNRVLLVYASSYAPDTLKVIKATGAFTVVDGLDASMSTPTLPQLQMYDAILVFSDSGFQNAATLGNVVADYFDAGGRVVIATFANASVAITGRFGAVANGYMLINPTGQEQPMDSLGQINEPQSPLVVGVTKLTAQAAFRSMGGPVNGGVVVAQWASGKPLIVRGVVKGRNRVDVNMYPPSGGVRPDFWMGDGNNILRNALLYQ